MNPSQERENQDYIDTVFGQPIVLYCNCPSLSSFVSSFYKLAAAKGIPKIQHSRDQIIYKEFERLKQFIPVMNASQPVFAILLHRDAGWYINLVEHSQTELKEKVERMLQWGA